MNNQMMNDLRMFLKIFKSALLITNKVYDNYMDLDDKDKFRVRILYIMKSKAELIYKLLEQDIDNEMYLNFDSVAILTRTLIEAYTPFYHLTSETDINQSEWELRWYIFALHDVLERIKMLEFIQVKDSCNDNDKELKSQEQELKAKIKTNSFYKEIKTNNHENYKDIAHKDIQSNKFNTEIKKKRAAS